MPNHLRKWLEKAVFTSGTDLAAGGLLSPEQARAFLRVAMDETVILREARIEDSNATKFEVPRMSFHNKRVLTNKSEGARVATADQQKPATGLVTLSTNLFGGEVPISDETFEDNIEREGFADTLVAQIAEAVGRDIEEIGIKSDTDRVPGDSEDVFDQFNGMIALAQDDVPAGQKYDATGISDVETLFDNLIEKMPSRYRRNPRAMRIYAPVDVVDAYERAIKARGTTLGDEAIGNGLRAPTYRGYPVMRVPLFSGTGLINSVAIDYSEFAVLCNPKNIIVGFHRRVKLEQWREPREGVRYFLPTVRFDLKFANPDELTLAENIDTI